MIEYTVKVFDDRTEWYLNGKRHREDGPAWEAADGTKYWYLNGVEFTQSEFNKKTQSEPSFEGKIIEVDGKKYKLTSV